jgi:hypothetical protein
MKSRTLAFLFAIPAAALAQHEHHAAPGQPATVARPATERIWTPQPLLLPGKAARGERASAVLHPQGIAAAHVTVFAAEGPAERLRVDYPVEATGAKIASVTPKTGNYHWVVAREEHPDEVRVASTPWYFGNPGDSPKDLLKVARHELEIVPAPLPREHGNYRESEKWSFLVRFKGQPLAGQTVRLETELGSRSTFLTDATGHATVLFPRDFRAQEGKVEDHERRRAKFVLSAEKESDGRKYLTAFNYTYAQDADRDRSLGWGAFFGLVGMVAAMPLLRRREMTTGGNDHA